MIRSIKIIGIDSKTYLHFLKLLERGGCNDKEKLMIPKVISTPDIKGDVSRSILRGNKPCFKKKRASQFHREIT